MYTKLTLNVDGNVIRDAKIYAKKHQISLSKIIEKYLRNITSRTKTDSTKQISTIVDELSGILGTINKENSKDAKYQYLKKKYNL